MVAAHGRPWISFYRPLPVPSTLQRSSERPFFAHPLRKYAAALKPRFWFRRKKKKKKIIVDEFHIRYLIQQSKKKKKCKKRNLGLIFLSPLILLTSFLWQFSMKINDEQKKDFNFENFFRPLRRNFLISETRNSNGFPTFNERERQARDWLDRIVCSLDAITRDLPLNFNLATLLNYREKGIVKQFN